MKDNVSKKLETILDDLSKTSIWVFSSLVVIIITVFSHKSTTAIPIKLDEDVYKIFGFEVNREYAGIIMFSILLGLNFYLFKLFLHLYSNYRKERSDFKTKQEMDEVLTTHSWIFNPFANTSIDNLSRIIDVSGYPLLNLIWWLGFSLAFKLTFNGSLSLEIMIICITLAILFVILGLASGYVINTIIADVSPIPARMLIANAAILIGVVIFFFLNQTFFKSNYWMFILAGLLVLGVTIVSVFQYKAIQKRLKGKLK